MDRRQMLGLAGAAATLPMMGAAVPIATAAVALRPRPEPLPVLNAYDVLTAEWMAALVNRVNELSDRA